MTILGVAALASGGSYLVSRVGFSLYDRFIGIKLPGRVHNVSVIGDMIMDNAWISTFFLTILLKVGSPRLSLETIQAGAVVVVSTCSLSWLVRTKITERYPLLKQWIGPRVSM